MSIDAPLGATPQGGAFDLTGATAVEPSRSRGFARPGVGRAHVAIAAVPLLGLLLCVAGTHTNLLVPQTIQPVTATPMAGPFKYIGFSLDTPSVVVAIVCLFASYLLTIKWIDRISARTVIWAVVALNVIVLIGPPLFSTDVFSYQAYARMFTIYHTNPYTHGPAAIQLDGIYQYIGAKWISTPSVYGPLFTFISGAFASASISTSEFAFKLLAALASGGTLYILWQASKLRGLNPVRSIALFGLNPLVTLYGVGGGHNDLLMLMLTTAGVYAVLRHRERTAGALISAGAAIKLTGGVVFPFALLSGVRLDAPKRRRGIVLGAAAVAVVVAGASFAVFGTGILDMPTTLQNVQDQGAWQSVPGFMFAVTRLNVTEGVRLFADVVLVGWVLWLLWRVWQGRMDWIDGAAWATFAVLVTAWAMLPWYVAWMMPLVALGTSRRLWHAAVFITLVAGAMMVAGAFPNGLGFLNI
jgi:hypothetical protein